MSLGNLARLLGLYRHRRIAGRLVFRESDLYDAWQEIHLRKLLDWLDVDCVFDVGAHRGEYATMLRERVGFRGRIISFEPIPELARELRERSHRDPDWHIEELALSDKVGRESFNVMEVSEFSSLGTPRHDDSRLFVQLNKINRTVEVDSATLGATVSRLRETYQFNRPFLKLDTQGADVAIVAAGRDVICEFVGLQSELAITKLYEESVDFREAINFYEQCGFSLCTFMPINPSHFPRMFEIDCLMVRKDLLQRD